MGITRLKYLSSYLIGPIDADPNLGKSWRDEMEPFLTNLGVRVFNPLNKPVEDGSEVEQRELRDKLLKEQRYDEFRVIMKRIRAIDLRFTDLADFLVVNFDMKIPMCGTFEEICTANRQRKPIIIMCPQGKHNLPQWLFAQLPHQLFFSSWEQVKVYLNHINTDENVDTVGDRWLFFTR